MDWHAALNCALIGLITVLALRQKTLQGFIIAVALSLGFTLFAVVEPRLSDVGYYVGAASVDLLLVYIIGSLRPISLFAITLQRLCIFSIIVNTVGFMLWAFYQPATVYNWMVTLVHGYMALVLWRGDRDGIFTNDTRPYTFRFDPSPCLLSVSKGLKEL